MHDLKFALRQLLKNPGFTAVAVLTLALGIGANTAIFSVVNGVLIRPLPFKDPERLVMVFERGLSGSQKGSVSAPLLGGWREQTTVFEGLAARGFGGFILTGKGQPENMYWFTFVGEHLLVARHQADAWPRLPARRGDYR